jgi:cytochrome c-type protein NapC
MDYTEQGNRAARMHPKAFDEGKTCIDCHKGIAHQLPADRSAYRQAERRCSRHFARRKTAQEPEEAAEKKVIACSQYEDCPGLVPGFF